MPVKKFPPLPIGGHCAEVPLLLALQMALLTSALALDPGRAPSEYGQDTWGPEEGLPQVSVQALAQDAEGFLWLGSQEGLVRFDGLDFRTWGRRQVPEMSSSSVTALAVAGEDTLWLGTSAGGVLRKAGEQWTAWTEAQGLLSDTVTALQVDELGDLWVGTDHGLSRISGDGIAPGTKELPRVEDLLLDHRGHLWVGTRGGVYRMEQAEPLPVPGLGDLEVLDLHQGLDGAIWVGTRAQGLVRWEEGQVRAWGPEQGLPGDEVRAITEDPHGNLWLGTGSTGLLRLDPHGELSSAGPLSAAAQVECLLVDRDESLWVGSFAEGLHRLRDTPFRVLGREEGLPEDLVWTLHEEAPGLLWVGGVGLSRVEHGRVVPWEGQAELEGVHVTSVVTDRAGALWVGTRHQGVLCWREGEWTRWTPAEGLPHLDVFSLALDPRGSVWAGTRGGLARMGEAGVEVWGTEEGLPSEHVRSVYFDDEGALWVGTYGGGAARMSGSTFQALDGTEELELAQRVVLALHRDAEGVLWMGTQGGVLRWDGERLGQVGWRHGLPDDNVFAILEDHAGQLWMSSNRGVFTASRQELTEVATGQRGLLRPRVFGRSDGLVSPECSGGNHPSALAASDGRLWFATVAGAASVDLLALHAPGPPARTRVERFLVDQTPATLDSSIRLRPGLHRLEAHYTAPALVGADQLEYQVRVQGLHQDWQPMGAARTWAGEGLRPGRYSLQARACHPWGGCGPASEAVAFELLPQPWETWPFTLLVGAILVVLGGILGALTGLHHRVRSRALAVALAQRAAEVEALSEDLHQLSLKDPLTGLRSRRYLLEALEPVLEERCQSGRHADRRRARRQDLLVLCLMDIDRFKRVNDVWGQEAGDGVLAQLAELLRELTRPGDMLVRWGGEEFVVVLPSVPPAHVPAFARRLRQAVAAREFSLPGDHTTRITCSVGVAILPFGEPGLGLTVDRLVGLADTGVYKAKRDGGNAAIQVHPGEAWSGTLEELVEAISDPQSAIYAQKLEMERLG